MKRSIIIGVVVVVLVLVLGSGAMLYRTSSPAADATFGGVSLRLDYATTTAAQEQGLSGRAEVPGDYGMLFVFDEASRYGFWMKDMLVPIDLFWLDDSLQVVAISADVAPATYPDVFYPPVPVRYVLETEAGFAAAHGIATGTPLQLKNH